VIVVGNVVAGGAGKTPVVIEIVRHLAAQGWQPGVVSRGYGRTDTGPDSAAIEVTATTPVDVSGDEPALIHQASGVPVFVASHRIDAALALLAAHPDTNVIVCDDGLQHLALQRDIEVCVFDQRGVGNGWLLPAGPLREPWPRKPGREVDFVLQPPALQRQLAHYALRADGSRIDLADLIGSTLVAVAGIAQPEVFFTMLRAQGLALQETIALPDHYNFDSFSRNTLLGYTLICTQKDAAKLWPSHPQALAVPLLVDLPADFFPVLLEKLSLAGRLYPSSALPPTPHGH
jgi:tetraacyldisaccharide 4'-kinase